MRCPQPAVGGCEGGTTLNPKELSKFGLECLSRRSIEAIADFIGPDLDIPAPDVYTNAMIMDWMMDQYSCEGSVCNIIQDHSVVINEELFTLDVNILVPAALENQITVD